MTWKSILLAGGSGSRLYPVTATVNKHLLPVYDKPMIYYPISTLMLGGIREFILISSPEDIGQFKALLGDGSQWGAKFEYCVQEQPRGIAEAFLIAEHLIAGSNVALSLGDNIFYGSGLSGRIQAACQHSEGATIFGYEVADPRAFGVVEVDKNGMAISLEEKPAEPKSNLAVPGLYFYDKRVVDFAKSLQPSGRGELEITDVNRLYMEAHDLRVQPLGRGVAWLDGGTAEALYEASQFIKVVEERTGLKIACLEEIALHNGFVTADQLRSYHGNRSGRYTDYVMRVIEQYSREHQE